MKNLFLIVVVFFTVTLQAYSDVDFDGVEDEYDKCPNTPFTELVDINGCTIKSLLSPHSFDVVVGVSYSDSDYQTLNKTDTLSTTLQADYYYKNFSLQLASSYFTTAGNGYSDKGLNDSFIGIAYQFELLKQLYLRVATGVLLPTYKTSLNNNNTDYTASFNISYNVSDFSFFGSYAYTLINDSDTLITYDDNTTQSLNYQDTNAYNFGLGYYISQKLYMSFAYNSSDSIYKSIEDIETLSLYGYYGFNDHWFSTVSYSYGISKSASKNYFAWRLGYFF